LTSLMLSDVLESTGAVLLRGDASRPLTGVSTDTRTLRREELFLALSGPNFDGNRFAGEAVARGAGCLLLRSDIEPLREDAQLLRAVPGDVPIAACHSPRRALSDLAAWHRRRLDIPVVGITGSCGKTSTKNILLELLKDHFSAVGSPASFNNDIGVPHTLLMADEGTEALVVEMGTNAPGEIAGLCRTARPNVGIITNVGASHLEGLGSIEGVAREKGELAASLPESGFCVLNADCRWTPTLRESTRARVVTFSVEGMNGSTGDLDASEVWFHAGGTTFKLRSELFGVREVTMPLLGLHTVQNVLAALAACVGLGLDVDSVLPATTRLRDGRRRLERIEVRGMTLFDDSYNANPESARASVRVLAGQHGHARRVLVLGEMLELGEFGAELHHEIGVHAAEAGVDMLLLVGELTRATAAGALEGGLPADRVVHFDDLHDALEVVPTLLRDGDVALVKGSRATGLDRLVERLVEPAAAVAD